MQRSIFGYILKCSLRQQIIILGLTLAAMPFFYGSLELPKRIINRAIDPPAGMFPLTLNLPGPIIFEVGQIEFLVILCVMFLILVLTNGAFKYAINVYKGLLGERMLRRLRFQLYQQILRFPLARFRDVSHGETVSIITSEVEPLGGFIGDAFAQPLYQGGLLLTAFSFIFSQDAIMGIAVIALYPVQMVVIPRLQFQVNQLTKQRIREVRKLSNHITDSMSRVRDIRTNDTMRYELAGFSDALGRIFYIRYNIYLKKFFIKFLNNFLAQLTPFFFFMVGGWLVIKGELSLGALVAVLAAYKDLSPPWKELLGYYEDLQDARVRFDQIVAKFSTSDLETTEDEKAEGARSAWPEGELLSTAVTYSEDGMPPLRGIDLSISPEEHVAILGDANSGKDTLAQLLARLIRPTTGNFLIGGQNLNDLPQTVIGRSVGYIDSSPGIVSGTVFDNLVYGLKHNPYLILSSSDNKAGLQRKWQTEALAAGNSTEDANADWVDLDAANADTSVELISRALDALDVAGLKPALAEFGLRTRIDPDQESGLVANVLGIRKRLAGRLKSEPLCQFVELFDRALYNSCLTVAENIIFGLPVNETLDLASLTDDRYLRSVLKSTKLDADLRTLGLAVARQTSALSSKGVSSHVIAKTLPVNEDDILRLKVIAGLTEDGDTSDLRRSDRRLLVEIALQLNADRHVNVTVDDTVRLKIITARQDFQKKIPESYRRSVEFFDQNLYHPALTIRENMIFGEIREGQHGAVDEVNNVILEEIGASACRSLLEQAGLGFQVGIKGAYLTAAERIELAIARSILKRPRLLILNGATSELDTATENDVIGKVREILVGRCLVVVLDSPEPAGQFDRVIKLKAGRVQSENSIS